MVEVVVLACPACGSFFTMLGPSDVRKHNNRYYKIFISMMYQRALVDTAFTIIKWVDERAAGREWLDVSGWT